MDDNDMGLSEPALYSWYSTSNQVKWMFVHTETGRIVAEVIRMGIEYYAYWIVYPGVSEESVLLLKGKYISLDKAKKAIEVTM